jgi:hypothetical protein
MGLSVELLQPDVLETRMDLPRGCFGNSSTILLRFNAIKCGRPSRLVDLDN